MLSCSGARAALDTRLQARLPAKVLVWLSAVCARNADQVMNAVAELQGMMKRLSVNLGSRR
jgi:hypothetical protein